MAAITYTFAVRDNAASPPGTRMTGLAPTWAFLKKLSDNTDVTPQPAIAEVAQGQYKFTFDAEAVGEAAGQIDAGSTLASPADRYLDVLLTRDSSRIQSGLGADGKVTAKVAPADVSGPLPADVTEWLGAAPNALQSGRVDAHAGATAAALTFDLTGDITGNLSGSVGSVTGNVGGNVVGSVGSVVGLTIPTYPANFAALAIDASGRVTLAPAGLDAVTVETNLNARQALSVVAAAEAGKVAGAGTATITISAAGDGATTRVQAAVDNKGNRTGVTLTPPA